MDAIYVERDRYRCGSDACNNKHTPGHNYTEGNELEMLWLLLIISANCLIAVGNSQSYGFA